MKIKYGIISLVFTLFITLSSHLIQLSAVDDEMEMQNYTELFKAINGGNGSHLKTINDIEIAAKDNAEMLTIPNGREVYINMNSKKIFTPEAGEYKRPFNIDGGTLTIKNGSLIANGGGTTKENGYGVYGSVVMDTGYLNLENMYLENYRPWGLNVKTGKGTANLKNVIMKSSYGGGLEVSGGTANMYDCNLTQTNYFDHCSTLVSASSGGKLNVYSGNYTGDNWIVYVFNSGATINLHGGYFQAGKAVVKADKSTTSTPSKINIYGGQYDGTFQIADGAYLNIYAGVFKNTGLSKDDFSKHVVNTSNIYELDGVFTVAPKTTSVELNKTLLSLEEGESDDLVASLLPSGTIDPISWTSSNTSIVTVDTNGKVTAIAEGTATITATAGDKSATCVITVTEVPTPVEPPVVPEKPTVDVPTIDTTTPPKEVIVGVQDKASQKVISDTVNSILGDITSGKDISKDVMSSETLNAVKEALAAGKSVSPKVNAKTVDIKSVDKTIVSQVNELVKKLMKTNNTKATVAQYLDLGVLLMADSSELGSVNQLDKPIEFTVGLPTELAKAGRVFYIVRIHNGVAEKLATKMNSNKTLTFETDKFSTYAIVYEEGTVKTSDDSQTMLYVSFGTLAIVGAGLVLLFKKKEELMK